VKVNDGAFKDFIGTVQEVIPEKRRLKIMVSIFGRGTPVELDVLQVEAVDETVVS
jgi:transcriptional antiterminator NusG